MFEIIASIAVHPYASLLMTVYTIVVLLGVLHTVNAAIYSIRDMYNNKVRTVAILRAIEKYHKDEFDKIMKGESLDGETNN